MTQNRTLCHWLAVQNRCYSQATASYCRQLVASSLKWLETSFLFGHTPDWFSNDRKNLGHFVRNVQKYRLTNAFTASFSSIITWQMTEMSQREKPIETCFSPASNFRRFTERDAKNIDTSSALWLPLNHRLVVKPIVAHSCFIAATTIFVYDRQKSPPSFGLPSPAPDPKVGFKGGVLNRGKFTPEVNFVYPGGKCNNAEVTIPCFFLQRKQKRG